MAGDRLVRVAHHALVFVFVVALVGVLSAQAVIDPQYVEFDASPSHNALHVDGTPIVSSYRLSLYPQGSSTAFATVSLGKPTPNASNVIRVDFLALLPTVPTPGVTFVARVTAVGPGGDTASGLSNTFSFTGPCAPGITPTNRSVSSGAATGSVTVSAGVGCSWSAASNAGWISLTGSTSGSGNGTVAYSIAANSSGLQRVGSLTIAGQTFTVTQSGVACTISLSPTSTSVAAGGGNGSTAVTAPAGCSWTAVSDTPGWLTITSGASGTGNGTVSFSVSANSATQTRQGTLSIDNRDFTVNQAAAPCTYSLSPSSTSVGAGGGSVATSMTAPAGCAWTAVSNAPAWLTVSGGASGNGGGTITVAAATNTAAQTRQGTVTIGGQTYTVNQAAAGCTFTLNPASASAPASGASGTTSVTAPAGCAWTASSNATGWLTVTSGSSGSGSGTIAYAASVNPQSQSRQGTITIGGQAFTVNQAAGSCSFSINPSSSSVAATGGSGTASVTATAGCSWTSQSNASWISFTTATGGTGNGSVGFSVAANSTGSQRSGTMTIAGRTYTVTQAENTGCNYSINPTSQSIAPGGGTATVALTVGTNCYWTATSAVGWITLSEWGAGSRTLTFTVAPNTSGSTRTGILTIGGRPHTVTQASGTVPAAPRSLRVVIAINGGS